MRRAGVTADNGGSRTSKGRSNDLTWLPHNHATVKAFVEQVSELVGVPASHAEQVQVVHYTKDQQYRKRALLHNQVFPHHNLIHQGYLSQIA